MTFWLTVLATIVGGVIVALINMAIMMVVGGAAALRMGPT